MSEETLRSSKSEYTISHISHYFKETEELLRSRGKQPELGILSMPEVNNIMCGIPKNNLTVIGARTSMGKTSLTIQLMLDLMQKNKSILYLGFEMNQQELIERIFCNLYRIDNRKILFGEFENYYTQWEQFKEKYKTSQFIVGDKFGTSWKQLTEFLDELSVIPDVIIIDYIQAISQGQGQGKTFIDEYILNFRNLCIERNFAGIIVSQLNRQAQDRKDTTPQLHDLKGSGYLEELADLCLLLDWPGKFKTNESKNDFIINIAKNRRGPTGFCKVKYYPQHYLFTDWNAELDAVTDEILNEED